MKIKNYILLLVPLLACNPIPNLEVLLFNNVKEITGYEIILDDKLSFVTSVNNRLIAFDDHTKTNFISIYDDSTYKLITKIAPYGRGENEFTAIQYMRYSYIDKTNGDMSVLVMDYLKSKYHAINIDESPQNNKQKINFSIKNNRNHLILHNGIIDDTLALCYSVDKEEFYLYNYMKQSVIDNKINVNEGISNERLKYNLSCSAVYNIKKKRYFIYYFIINRIISCDYDRGNMKDNAVNKKLINCNDIIYDPNEPSLMSSYYMDCVYDDNYVYLLGAEMSYNDYENNPKPVTIDIFDWYSNPQMKLTVKEPLKNIALNKEKNILYGTTYSGQLYKYLLPKF